MSPERHNSDPREFFSVGVDEDVEYLPKMSCLLIDRPYPRIQALLPYRTTDDTMLSLSLSLSLSFFFSVIDTFPRSHVTASLYIGIRVPCNREKRDIVDETTGRPVVASVRYRNGGYALHARELASVSEHCRNRPRYLPVFIHGLQFVSTFVVTLVTFRKSSRPIFSRTKIFLARPLCLTSPPSKRRLRCSLTPKRSEVGVFLLVRFASRRD